MKIHSPDWPRTLLYIFIGAVLVRGIFILTLQDGFYFPDSIEYDAAAVNLLTNGEFDSTYDRAPLYPIFLAGIYLLGGKSIFAVRLVEAIMGAGLAVLIATIGKRIGGKTIGTLAGLLWGFYPLGVFITGLVYPEHLTAILLVGATVCLVRKAENPLKPHAVVPAGLLFGAAALARPVVLGTIGVVTLWILYWERARGIWLAGLFLIGVALLLTPWTVRNYTVYGWFVPIDSRSVQMLPDTGTKIQNVDEKAEYWLKHPERFAVHFVREFLHFWQLSPDRIRMSEPGRRERWYQEDSRVVRNTIFSTNQLIQLVSILSVGPLFFFALIGTGAMWVRGEQRRNLSLFYGLILSFAIGYSFFFTQMRYRVPIEPYIVILSAYGLSYSWAIISERYLSRVKFCNP